MGLTGLLLGGAGIAIVGSAIANGQGGALLDFAKNALGGIGEFFKGLFNSQEKPEQNLQGTLAIEEETGKQFIDNNQIKTTSEISNSDIYAQYDMNQNLSNAYSNAFSPIHEKNLNKAQGFASNLPWIGKLFENENEYDAKAISLRLANQSGITAIDGDAVKNVGDSAAAMEPIINNILSKHSGSDDKSAIIQEVSDVLLGQMNDTEHQAGFAISADRAVMGNDTYEAAYNYINNTDNHVKDRPSLVRKKDMAESIADSMIEKRGLPLMEGKTDENEARKEVVDSVYDAINSCNYTDPMELSVRISDNLLAKDITFEKQVGIIEEFEKQKASGKFSLGSLENNSVDAIGDSTVNVPENNSGDNIGSKQVSGQAAQKMTSVQEGVQPTSVEQATEVAKNNQTKGQKTEKQTDKSKIDVGIEK